LQTQFNVKHSSYHVVVENAFGRFKNRFNCLKDLNVRKILMAVRFTECCIILHNFLEINNDSWDDLDDDSNDDSDDDSDSDDSDDSDENNNLNDLNENSLKRAGESKRNQIINQLI
jgi:hypothetical protein